MNKIKLEIEEVVTSRTFNFYGDEIGSSIMYRVFFRKPVLFGLFHVKRYIAIHNDDIDLLRQILSNIIDNNAPQLEFRWMRSVCGSSWDHDWDNIDYTIVRFGERERAEKFIEYIESKPDKLIQTK